MAKVRVGLVGCGFVSELHMYAYKRVYGLDAEVKAVAARGDRVSILLRNIASQRPTGPFVTWSPIPTSTSSTSAPRPICTRG